MGTGGGEDQRRPVSTSYDCSVDLDGDLTFVDDDNLDQVVDVPINCTGARARGPWLRGAGYRGGTARGH